MTNQIYINLGLTADIQDTSYTLYEKNKMDNKDNFKSPQFGIS